MGTLTALAISMRFSHTLSLARSWSGSSVSRTAYLAMSARSSGVPKNFLKISAAGRSSFWDPKNFLDTLSRLHVKKSGRD